MKGKSLNGILIFIFAAGLSLLLYPIISSHSSARHQSRIIAAYSRQVDEMKDDVCLRQWDMAAAYNCALLQRTNPFDLTADLEKPYWELLSITDAGILAWVEIPSIKASLPIAHGTEECTLADYIGHMKWSSLPVGGESTHCVLSGHRGLPSSELFTNLDRLELGDPFYIHVLNQTLKYQVDNIAVVAPDDYALLGIEEGRDLCTLVTCTPYGVNSHRLLVRGVRVAD